MTSPRRSGPVSRRTLRYFTWMVSSGAPCAKAIRRLSVRHQAGPSFDGSALAQVRRTAFSLQRSQPQRACGCGLHHPFEVGTGRRRQLRQESTRHNALLSRPSRIRERYAVSRIPARCRALSQGGQASYPAMPERYFPHDLQARLTAFGERALVDRSESLLADFPKAEGNLTNTWRAPAIQIHRIGSMACREKELAVKSGDKPIVTKTGSSVGWLDDRSRLI